MDSHLKENLNVIKQAFKDHNISRAYLFGSAASDDVHPNDYDFLIVFSEEVSLLDYADMYFDLKFKLEEILNAQVDLITERSLKNPVLKQEIFKSRIPIYEAA